MTDLEKMDELRKRFDISYAQAKAAIEETEGDLGAAIVNLEERGTPLRDTQQQQSKQDKQDAEAVVKNIIEQVKGIIQEGNVTKVRLKKGGQTLIEIPATIGVVGLGILLFSPLMLAVTAIGAVAAVSQEMVFEIEKKDGTIERRYLKWPEVVSEKHYNEADTAGYTTADADDSADEPTEEN